MPQYVELKLEDGATILVEVPTEKNAAGYGDVSLGKNVVNKVGKTFSQALSSVKQGFVELNKQFQDIDVEEMELTAAIKMTGEGNFGIGKVGAEGTMEVKLKWKKSSN